MKKKFTIGQLALHAVFVVSCLTYILPLMLLISISISNEADIKAFGYSLIPRRIDFAGYEAVLQNPFQLLNSYKTTIIFSVTTVMLALVLMSLMAYVLSRKSCKFKGALTFYIFFTMLFGGGLIPSYLVNTQILNLGNSIWIYILPALVDAWYVIMMRTFFQGIPESLVESAKIDGAREFTIYLKVVMPLSKPVLATVGFMMLIAKWNDWNTALIYIRDAKLYSLQYMLQKILREIDFVEKVSAMDSQFSEYELPKESMRYAMAVLAAGPMLVVFPFFQKHFTKGITVGAVKG